ncbi:MAG: hypothetical protein S4CHLAM2_07500 [Chlamydiales bacterium]|nr:hypothetical protein [Chlamydiales bacterium]
MLLKDYMNGWKEENKAKVLDTLADDCIIIESHGPTYRGKDTVNQWFVEWFQLGNKIEKWKISSLHSVDNLIFCEWVFAYLGPNSRESFEGMTVAKIKNNKIFELREYRATAFPFPWKPAQT